MWFTVTTSHSTKGHMQISFTFTVVFKCLSQCTSEAQFNILHKSHSGAVSVGSDLPLTVSHHPRVWPEKAGPLLKPSAFISDYHHPSLSLPSGWKCLVWASSRPSRWARGIFFLLQVTMTTLLKPAGIKERVACTGNSRKLSYFLSRCEQLPALSRVEVCQGYGNAARAQGYS